jgi:uncharacterized membrane protein YbhN (UPF0104 family)
MSEAGSSSIKNESSTNKSTANHSTENQSTGNTTTEKNTTNEKPKKTWVNRLSQILTIFFFILVPVLLYFLVKNLEWQEVKDAINSFKLSTLLLGFAIAMISYGVFSSYDLLARHYVKHTLPATKILPSAFVCYAANLNLSAWVGSFAVRLRLYSRLGLSVGDISKIISINILTNWLGYIVVAGIIFSLRLLNLPDSWSVGDQALQFIGFGLLLAAAGYLLACAFATRRTWKIRAYEITLPTFTFAILQAMMGAFNWCLMGLLVFVLLPDGASYPTVLGILLICSIAGVVTHIPAGLGVLEAVFLAMLQHEFSKGQIIAALLGYRTLYFLIPLAIAVIVYLVLEKTAKKSAGTDTEQA